MDIFDHVTSLARASRSRSRVSKNRRGHFISVSRLTTVTRARQRLHFDRSVGGTALNSTLPKNPFINRMYTIVLSTVHFTCCPTLGRLTLWYYSNEKGVILSVRWEKDTECDRKHKAGLYPVGGGVRCYIIMPKCTKIDLCMKFGKLLLKKITKFVATKWRILQQNAPNSISAGAPPQTPLGELTALPQTPSWI